jgi:hypothetical protein
MKLRREGEKRLRAVARGLLLAALLTSLPVPAGSFEKDSEAFASHAGWRLVAGDAHRHAGTAQSLVAAERVASGGRCPHEYGEPMAIYAGAREAGYQWLNLSYHVGVGNIVKPDGTPHTLVESPIDLAFKAWTRPARAPIEDARFGYVIRPDSGGFPDHVRGGFVQPGYNEPLSLGTAADASNLDGEFIAMAGREFTTRHLTPVGGEAGQGGHKTVLLPAPATAGCGVALTRSARPRCRSERDLYTWLEAQGGLAIQAHPGGNAVWLPADARHPGGLSDRFVVGVEVGTRNRFRPTWEHAYQRALGQGLHLFPAYGSDLHLLGGPDACAPGGHGNPSEGSTLCWVTAVARDGLMDSMRARRCYYARSHAPALRFELRNESAGRYRAMGSRISEPASEVSVRIEAVSDPASQSAGEAQRFSLLEDSLSVYDEHYELDPQRMRRMAPALADLDFECDFYGTKDPARSRAELLISVRSCSRPLRGYAFDMLPAEANAIHDLRGHFFHLAETRAFGVLSLRKRALQFRHLHKNGGFKRYTALALQALYERAAERG